MKIRFFLQTIFLGLFLYLLWQTVFPISQSLLPVDLFLRSDPLVGTLIPLVSKNLISNLLPSLVVLLITIFLGRIFCGYFCPMGTTLDLSRAIFKTNKNSKLKINPNLKHLKYLILILMAVAAFFGINHIFWGSPIALITKFYSLLIHPLLQLLGSFGLTKLRPVFESQDLLSLAYTQINPRIFHTVYFIAIFFGVIFALEKVRPRFWCRYLCPAGAILALLSWKSFWRRKVNNYCIHCGKCVEKCPTSAINPGGNTTKHGECITCRNCVKVCPVKATSFSLKHGNNNKEYDVIIDANVKEIKTPALPSRRAFLNTAVAGASLAALGSFSGSSFLIKTNKATLNQLGLIRPPAPFQRLIF